MNEGLHNSVRPKSLLLAFSGQRDAVEQCAAFATTYPRRDLYLMYVNGIGVRPDPTPPRETAKHLRRSYPSLRALVIANGSRVQYDFLTSLPEEFAAVLGIRTQCIACQISLRVVRIIAATQLNADIALTPTEAIGWDLAPSLQVLDQMAMKRGIGQTDCPSPTSLTLPIFMQGGPGTPCALARFHATAQEIDQSGASSLARWVLCWGEQYLDKVARIRDDSPGGALSEVLSL
jgi:hypothetical protein